MDRNDYYGGESSSLNLIQVLFSPIILSNSSLFFVIFFNRIMYLLF